MSSPPRDSIINNRFAGKKNSVMGITVTNTKPIEIDDKKRKLIARPCRDPEIVKVKSPGFKLHFIPEKNTLNVEDFIKKNVNFDLKCPLCHDLQQNPMACSKCLQEFCKTCIEEQIKKHSKCPKCFNIIFAELLQPASETLAEKYESTFLKCPFKGCLEEFNLHDFKCHAEICAFKEVKDEKDFSRLINNDKHDMMEENRLIEYFKRLYGLDEMESNLKSNEDTLSESKLAGSKINKSKSAEKKLKLGVSTTQSRASMISKKKKGTQIINTDVEFECLKELSKLYLCLYLIFMYLLIRVS